MASDPSAAARADFLPFSRPFIGDDEIELVSEVLRSGWLTTGPRVNEFERLFAEYLGVEHAVAVSSATAALHLALEAVGLKRDDEVITTPYTFAATAEVIRYFDARPVFVDIRETDFNIDANRIEEAITGRTRVIMPVHMAGQACAMEEIVDIARRHNLSVIEDAAHALPTRYRGRMVGTIGDLTAFSFYATKNLTTGEGGMLTTNNADLADRIRMMSLHGISKDAWKRYTQHGSWYYEILAPGFKYNMTDVAAAIGLCQLKKLQRMTERRTEIAARYTSALTDMPQLELPQTFPDSTHAWHLYIIRLNLANLTIDRGTFIDQLVARNIGTSVHFIPLHLHPYYRETYGYEPGDFPIANSEFRRVISLPIYAAMSDQDVEDVIAAVRDVAQQNGRMKPVP